MKFVVFTIMASMTALLLRGEAVGLNVRDFGALGDGQHDDTAAIQAALYAASDDGGARRQSAVGLCPLGIPDFPTITGVGETTAVPEVFLPAGRYRISQTLAGVRTAVLRGEPGTILEMTDPARDILYLYDAFRCRVEGIEFQGGNRQVLISTRNNESARILVKNCRFLNASGSGIDCRSYKNPAGTDWRTIPLPAYQMRWENGMPVLTPNDWTGKERYYNSTLFVCRDNTFENCRLAVTASADGTTIADCDVTASESPAFRLEGGPARLLRLHGTATGAADGCWIESLGFVLAVRDSVFDGQPRTLIQKKLRDDTDIPSSILVTNTRTHCGGASENAVLFIENQAEENTPSILELYRVRESSGLPVKAIAWELTPDRDRLLQGRRINQSALDAYKATLVEWPYHISFGENEGLDETIPAALEESLTASVIPDDMRVKPPQMTWPKPVQSLHAVDFGVDLDDATDDTAAMQQALDASGKQEGLTVLELPAARIRISDTLRLPPELILTAPGRSWIMQTTPERPVFTGVDIRKLKVENLNVTGDVDGKTECGPGFDLNATPDGELEWSDCGFYSIDHTGIIVSAPQDNQVKLRVADSTFITVRCVLDSSAALAEVTDLWITTHGRMNEEAVIVNRYGGAMLVPNILGVPGIMKYHNPPHLPYVKDWPNGNNLRWIDNYGKLDFLDNRMGGEWMGFCLVYNRDPRATVYMDGGFGCFFSEWSKKNILYCEYAPAMTVIRNMGWYHRFPDSAVVGTPEFLKTPEVIRQNIIY